MRWYVLGVGVPDLLLGLGQNAYLVWWVLLGSEVLDEFADLYPPCVLGLTD